MYITKNKKNFILHFKNGVLPSIKVDYEQDGKIDRPARREAWNNYIDILMKDGELPKKAENWTCPW